MTAIAIPADFAERMRLTFADGERWLGRLPALLAEAAARWDLELGAPVARLSYNYVTAATRADGTPAILKLGVPREELACEIDALRLYAGRGAVELLDADAERGFMLLERLSPGEPLARLFPRDDDEATLIAARAMRATWHAPPAGHRFPHISAWIGELAEIRPRFGGTTGPFPPRLVEQAETLFAELLASPRPEVVLHGDLHHENILSAGREPWLVIDPKGIVGEPEYEIGALIRNPQPDYHKHPDLARLLARRLDLLADALGFDRQRLWAWSFAQMVLSTWWDVATSVDGGAEGIYVAGVLAGLE